MLNAAGQKVSLRQAQSLVIEKRCDLKQSKVLVLLSKCNLATAAHPLEIRLTRQHYLFRHCSPTPL